MFMNDKLKHSDWAIKHFLQLLIWTHSTSINISYLKKKNMLKGAFFLFISVARKNIRQRHNLTRLNSFQNNPRSSLNTEKKRNLFMRHDAPPPPPRPFFFFFLFTPIVTLMFDLDI